MSPLKNYQIQNDVPYPHVGEFLREYFRKHKISQPAISKKIGVAENGVTGYMKNESIQFGILWKIGVATGYNFLAAIADTHPMGYITRKEAELREELAEKNSRINDLEKELAIYRRIVGK